MNCEWGTGTWIAAIVLAVVAFWIGWLFAIEWICGQLEKDGITLIRTADKGRKHNND